MNTQAEMPFLQHLEELRNRIFFTLIGVTVASIVSYYWCHELFDFINGPLRKTFQNVELIGTGPADAFIVKIKVALLAGFILSSPFTFLQMWKFISPGLLEKEKKFAFPFVFFTTAFFLSGISFCFYVALPFAFDFFSAEFLSIGIIPQIRITEYLSFVMKLALVFGLVFEMPVGCYFLARLGLVTHTWLIEKLRYATVVIFIVAAILTPPDVASQIMLALPLMVLYGFCIIIAYFVGKNRNATVVIKAENYPSDPNQSQDKLA